jgi:hypothetical protein
MYRRSLESGRQGREYALAPAGQIAGDSDFPFHLKNAKRTSFDKRRRLLLYVLIATVNAALWGIFWYRSSRTPAALPPDVLWPSLFSATHTTHLITSDPDIVVLQEITGAELTVSDYANHKYIPDSNKLTPEQMLYSHKILRWDNSSSALDPPIAASIAVLAQKYSRKMDVRAARSIQLADLNNDDSFVFLGSPRSDPWAALYDDELDFRFAFDSVTRQEIVVNAHPLPLELPRYVPTASGKANGQVFAIMAFIQNLDQNGQVLLLAGTNCQGTEAAGKLAADLPRLSATLQRCGIAPSSPIRHFELLMRVNTMAGAPNSSDVVACHILPGDPGQKR